MYRRTSAAEGDMFSFRRHEARWRCAISMSCFAMSFADIAFFELSEFTLNIFSPAAIPPLSFRCQMRVEANAMFRYASTVSRAMCFLIS